MGNIKNEWFSTKRISERIIAISESEHWEKTNCYLVLGDKRCALIDTGTGLFGIKDVIRNFTDKDIIVITTHFHWDHIGNHSEFDNIYIHKNEIRWCDTQFPLPENVVKNMVVKDVDPRFLDASKKIGNYKLFHGDNINIVTGGEEFDLGGKVLKIINTPGHSPGHICVVDEGEKYIFSGDLVYSGTLYCNYETTDPVDFSKSICTLRDNFSGYKILPGHNKFPLGFTLLNSIADAFDEIGGLHDLKHGLGRFDYKDFSILI